MKNTRVIIAIVAFAVTFIFSAGLVRIIFPAPVVKYVYFDRPQLRPEASEIESFLLRDIRNGENRMDSKYDDDYAAAVMDYWQTSSSMDASQFPQDFQNAWRNHMQAWRNYADYLQEKKTGEKSYSCSPEKRLNSEVNRTWQEVLRIGRNYGSTIYQ